MSFSTWAIIAWLSHTYVVGLEELQVAQHTEPDEQVAGAQHDAAHLEVVRAPALDLDLKRRADHNERVVDDDHQIPEIEELQPIAHR